MCTFVMKYSEKFKVQPKVTLTVSIDLSRFLSNTLIRGDMNVGHTGLLRMRIALFDFNSNPSRLILVRGLKLSTDGHPAILSLSFGYSTI